VISKTTLEFWKRYDRLPRNVQKQAKISYNRFKKDPYYPSPHFECIDRQESTWSTRIGLRYRAVGLLIGDTIIWYFIGSHEEYNHLL
jgi:hypothetical protein